MRLLVGGSALYGGGVGAYYGACSREPIVISATAAGYAM